MNKARCIGIKKVATPVILAVFIILSLLPFHLMSQELLKTVYYTDDWQKTEYKRAPYVRLIYKDSARYKIVDRYNEGCIEMTGCFSSLDPDIKDGYFKYYTQSCHISEEGVYKNDKKEGLWKYYNWDGILDEEGIYVHDKKESAWKSLDSIGNIRELEIYKNNKPDSTWTSYFVNGQVQHTENYSNGKLNGEFISYYKDGKVKRKDEYKDSLMTKGTCYTDSGQVVKWYPYQQKPQFPGNVNKYLADNLNYPRQAIDANISGTVYVGFIVEKDGTIRYVRALRKVLLSPELNAEALRVVSSMPKWTPGMQDGELVRVHYMLPIHFILK